MSQEIITLSSDSESEDGQESTTASVSTTKIASTSTSIGCAPPPTKLLEGVSGFLNDFQTLSVEIQRLKEAEQARQEQLKQQQAELNKVGDEYSSVKAEAAKNELLMQAQEIQLNQLKQEADRLEKKRNLWMSKLGFAGRGLEGMFQRTTNLVKQDDQLISTENEGKSQLSSTNSQEQEKSLIQNSALVPSGYNFENLPCRPGILEKVATVPNEGAVSKLTILQEKLSQRMSEKTEAQQEMRKVLARKNAMLESLAELAKKKIMPQENFIEIPSKPVVDETGTEKNVSNNTSTNVQVSSNNATSTSQSSSETNHTRDISIPIKNGYGCTCGMRFVFIVNLHRHLGRGKEKFTCDVCKMTFLYFSALSRHLRENHEKSFPPNSHGCRYCGTVFPSKPELMKGWK